MQFRVAQGVDALDGKSFFLLQVVHLFTDVQAKQALDGIVIYLLFHFFASAEVAGRRVGLGRQFQVLF